MHDIVDDLSAPSLISAIEANLFGFMPAFGEWPRAEVHDEPEILWSMTDIPFPVFNGIMRAKIAPERVVTVIESIKAEAQSRSVPVLWWVGPSAQPSDLGNQLEKSGFVLSERLPGMAVELATLDDSPPVPEGFELRPVTDAEAFLDFMGYIDEERTRAYLGWLNGEPVAASLVLLSAGVAGIYNVATIPQARRKGIGARMTDMPLLESRAMGYKAAVLHSSEMGEGVYRSIGFEEYCKIDQYLWSPVL